MPALVAAILRCCSILLRPLLPYLLRFWTWLGLPAFFVAVNNLVQKIIGKWAVEHVVAALTMAAGLAAWGTFIGLIFTFFVGSGLREIFDGDPLAGFGAGALYLASHAFPLKQMVGLSFAYITWKFTMFHAAIVLNRTIKALFGF